MIRPPRVWRLAKPEQPLCRRLLLQLRASSRFIVGRFCERPMASGTHAIKHVYDIMNRRRFITLSSGVAGAVALNVKSTTVAENAVKPLRILILGGTGFTGPYQVRYALSRGHKVTTFNRGKTHPG